MGPVCQTSLPIGLSEWELGPCHAEWFPIDKCLVKIEKAFSLWVEDMNRKCVLTHHYVLPRKCWAHAKTSARDPLKQVTLKHLPRFRDRFGVKI